MANDFAYRLENINLHHAMFMVNTPVEGVSGNTLQNVGKHAASYLRFFYSPILNRPTPSCFEDFIYYLGNIDLNGTEYIKRRGFVQRITLQNFGKNAAC